MEKFTTLSGIAAPLRMINVDTDIIIPKQFLKTVKRTGLGIHAFNDIRFNEDGSEKPEFVLNKTEFRNASILITGENEADTNPEAEFKVDLENQTITRGNKISFDFDVDAHRKHCLINGLDDIGLTLEKKNFIQDYEAKDEEKRSWLY